MCGQEELVYVVGRDDAVGGCGVCVGKGGGAFGTGFMSIPFEFKGTEYAVFFFEEINLLLLLRAPEPGLSEAASIGQSLHAFSDGVVLPQDTNVRVALNLGKVPDNSIPDTEIIVIRLFLRCEDSSKRNKIQKYYKKFGMKSENLIRNLENKGCK